MLHGALRSVRTDHPEALTPGFERSIVKRLITALREYWTRLFADRVMLEFLMKRYLLDRRIVYEMIEDEANE